MSNNLTVNKNSEFFLTIVKQGIHSHLMLGVMVDNQPQILASVGKSNLIDESSGTSIASQFSLFKKELMKHANAALRKEEFILHLDSNYQAYSISFQQYLDFLNMLKAIHEDQLEFYQNRKSPEGDWENLTCPEKGVRNLRSGIRCFIPQDVNAEQVTFQENNILAYNNTPENINPVDSRMIEGARQLSVNNTCRTTACSILNYILGYSPQVPKFFAMNLEYRASARSFYILPPPPNCFKIDTTRMQVIQELYARLEKLPKNNPESEITKNKFNELKKLYQEITNQPQLSFNDLLEKINVHKNHHQNLFSQHRSEGVTLLIAKKLKLKTKTEQTYESMVKAVLKELKRLDKLNDVKPPCIEQPDSFRPLSAEELDTRSLQRIAVSKFL